MRIIAGEFRSRRLHTPRDDSITRPIPDRVKVSLFGLLRGNCENASVFDGFAGTGAIGLEALSRGAARCVFVEKDKSIARILERNIAGLGVQDRSEVVVGDCLGPGALSRCPRPVDLVFLDPPYPLARDPAAWQRVRTQFMRLIDLLSDGGFVILRTPWPFTHEPAPAGADAALDRPGSPRPGPRIPGDRTPRDRVRREKRSGRLRWQGGDHVIEVTLEEAGGRDLEEVLDEKIEQAEAPPRLAPPRARVDLSFPNAVGPETHIYHSTAIHLYMRKP